MEDASTRLIPLSGGRGAGQFVLIDAADYSALSKYTWFLTANGYAARVDYLGRIPGPGKARYKRETVMMARQIMGDPQGVFVDHISGNRLDNRRCNLRMATGCQNSQNAALRKDNKSGYKGVSYAARNKKWRAIIYAERKQINLGYFATAEEAKAAYDDAALKYHGHYARK